MRIEVRIHRPISDDYCYPKDFLQEVDSPPQCGDKIKLHNAWYTVTESWWLFKVPTYDHAERGHLVITIERIVDEIR